MLPARQRWTSSASERAESWLTAGSPDGGEGALSRLGRGLLARSRAAQRLVALADREVDLDEVRGSTGASGRERGRGSRVGAVRTVAVLIDDNTFLNLWEEVETKKIHAELIPEIVRLLLAQGVTVYTLAQGESIPYRFQQPFLP